MAASQLGKGQPRPFFVYGTLLPGQPNEALWRQAVVHREQATLANGRLYDMGHYPMLVPHEGEQIKGMVMHVQPAAYTAVLDRLDRLEGYDPARPVQPGYRRVVRAVRLQNGAPLETWVYLGQADLVVGHRVIPGGDWAAYVRQQQPALRDWWTAVDTVAGRHMPPATWG